MMKRITSRIPWATIALEIGAILVLGLLFLLFLHHLDVTPWKDFFFANSDMLTLSLVWQSILHGEPFHWVFSSQVFLFPELPLYILSTLFSSNFKIAILFNAGLIVGLLYVLFRCISRSVSGERHKNVVIATTLTALPISLAILEYRNLPNIATFLFMTTAYYGVILSGLLSLWLSIKVIKASTLALTNRKLPKRKWGLLLSLLGLSLLTGTSNPLFFLQFSAPYLIVLTLLFWRKYIGKRVFLSLAAVQITGLIIGFAARKTLLKDLFSPLGEVTSYLHFDRMLPTIKGFYNMARQLLEGGLLAKIELAVGVALLLIALVLAVYFANSIFKKRQDTAPRATSLLLIGFGTVAPLSAIAGAVLTGNALTRYLLPVLVFTPIALIPFIIKTKLQPITVTIGLSAAATILVGLIIASGAQNAPTNLGNYYPSSAACIDKNLAGTMYKNGVAQYWRARVLQLNSHDNRIVEQVLGNVTRFGWLYNNAVYDRYDLSFVVIDKLEKIRNEEISKEGMFTLTAGTVIATIGEPSHVYQCDDFDIYTYDSGTEGHAILNQIVRDRTKGL